jgi:Domain of unknown function (DUF4908)
MFGVLGAFKIGVRRGLKRSKGPFQRAVRLRETQAARPLAFLRVLALAPVLALTFAPPSLGADEPPAVRLLLPPLAPAPADGRYMADDQLRFRIDLQDDQIRLRFIDSDEIFYLTSEPAPLGGRVLKYDTGEVALQVAGWGGLTLYTENDRGGVPAERADDEADGFEPVAVTAKDLKGFALKLAQDLAVAHDFGIGFAADWTELAQSDGVRALAVDAMRNAAYALGNLAQGPERDAIEDRFHLVRVIAAAEPGAKIEDGVLVISYTPEGGPSARPSSRAIARVLAETF